MDADTDEEAGYEHATYENWYTFGCEYEMENCLVYLQHRRYLSHGT